jgi:excisionase family DNA binding protein
MREPLRDLTGGGSAISLATTTGDEFVAVNQGGAMAADDQLLYKPETAGAKLELGRTAVYHLVKTGELRSVKIGRSRRIPASALEEYVQNLMRTGGGDAAA